MRGVWPCLGVALAALSLTHFPLTQTLGRGRGYFKGLDSCRPVRDPDCSMALASITLQASGERTSS